MNPDKSGDLFLERARHPKAAVPQMHHDCRSAFTSLLRDEDVCL